MKTFCLANHKGCAKTTTVLNLAVVLRFTGVLAVDLDLKATAARLASIL